MAGFKGSFYSRQLQIQPSTLADPGFPRGGGANPRGPGYDFIEISQKLHENEENSAGGGASPAFSLRSATAQ